MVMFLSKVPLLWSSRRIAFLWRGKKCGRQPRTADKLYAGKGLVLVNNDHKIIIIRHCHELSSRQMLVGDLTCIVDLD